jgi:hypothetical protein
MNGRSRLNGIVVVLATLLVGCEARPDRGLEQATVAVTSTPAPAASGTGFVTLSPTPGVLPRATPPPTPNRVGISLASQPQGDTIPQFDTCVPPTSQFANADHYLVAVVNITTGSTICATAAKPSKQAERLWILSASNIDLVDVNGVVVQSLPANVNSVKESDDSTVLLYGGAVNMLNHLTDGARDPAFDNWVVQTGGGTVLPLGKGNTFELSPDGMYVAYVPDAGWVALVEVATGIESQVRVPWPQSRALLPYLGVKWSPSSRFVIVWSMLGPSRSAFVVAPAMPHPRVVEVDIGTRAPVWLPDDRLLYTRDDNRWTLDLGTGAVTPATAADLFMPQEPPNPLRISTVPKMLDVVVPDATAPSGERIVARIPHYFCRTPNIPSVRWTPSRTQVIVDYAVYCG